MLLLCFFRTAFGKTVRVEVLDMDPGTLTIIFKESFTMALNEARFCKRINRTNLATLVSLSGQYGGILNPSNNFTLGTLQDA